MLFEASEPSRHDPEHHDLFRNSMRADSSEKWLRPPALRPGNRDCHRAIGHRQLLIERAPRCSGSGVLPPSVKPGSV